MNVIKLNKDSVFKTKIEKSEEFENSFFSDCYSKAYKGLKDIIENVPYTHTGLEETCYEAYQDDYNNIIAFLGERGSGKTSTMKSFALSLKEGNQNNEFEDNKDSFKEAYFDVLDVIDPSLFTHKESLVEIVVAEMFKCFRNDKRNNELLKKQKLVKQFEQVFQDIKTLNMDKQTIFKESNDNIETLIDLSSALSLKKDLKILIDLYISYINKDKNLNGKKKFLVIPIDDLDMNLSVGEKLLEDIRKYLIQANIIILMAVKFEQLQEIVMQKFVVGLRDNFSFYSQVYKNNEKSVHEPLVDFKNDIDEKTEKYLDKLIPYNRRCFMPILASRSILVEMDDYFANIKLSHNSNQESLGDLIKGNFYEKLNYIIISEDHYRAIIPENLRAFIELMMLLNSMENKDYKNNLYEIRNYYKEIIINHVNDRDDILFLRDILYCYFKDIKKRALIYLNTKILDEIGEGDFNLNDIKDDLRYVEKSKTLITGERITLGDLITWIKIYETIENSNKKRRFIEVFKSVYTIRLLHAYHKDLLSKKKPEERVINRSIGKDIIGKYFYITNNHNKNRSFSQIKLPDKLSIKESLSKILVEKNDKKGIIIKVEDKEVDDKINAITAKIPIIMKPSFDTNNYYSRLIRREKNKYETKDDLDRFKSFYINPFNIIGDSILKGDNNKVEFVINLDCFLKMLDLLDKVADNVRINEEENIKRIIGNFNKLYFNKDEIDFSYDKESEGYENINLVDDESMAFINDFVDDYLSGLIINDAMREAIDECEKLIELRLNYMRSKASYKGKPLRDTITELKKHIDKIGLEGPDVKKWIKRFDEYLGIFKAGSSIEAKHSNVIDFRNILEELRHLLNEKRKELEG